MSDDQWQAELKARRIVVGMRRVIDDLSLANERVATNLGMSVEEVEMLQQELQRVFDKAVKADDE